MTTGRTEGTAPIGDDVVWETVDTEQAGGAPQRFDVPAGNRRVVVWVLPLKAEGAKSIVRKHRVVQNEVALFIQERCIVGKDLWCPITQFQQAFAQWHGRPMAPVALGRLMRKSGYTIIRKRSSESNRPWLYAGVDIRKEEMEQNDLAQWIARNYTKAPYVRYARQNIIAVADIRDSYMGATKLKADAKEVRDALVGEGYDVKHSSGVTRAYGIQAIDPKTANDRVTSASHRIAPEGRSWFNPGMPSYAHATVVGHLGRDPELKDAGGTKACRMSIATNAARDKDKTTWWSVTAWGKQGELCAQYLKKGALVQVMGEASQRAYTTKDGEEKMALEINAQSVQFLDSKPKQDEPPF